MLLSTDVDANTAAHDEPKPTFQEREQDKQIKENGVGEGGECKGNLKAIEEHKRSHTDKYIRQMGSIERV